MSVSHNIQSNQVNQINFASEYSVVDPWILFQWHINLQWCTFLFPVSEVIVKSSQMIGCFYLEKTRPGRRGLQVVRCCWYLGPGYR